MMMRREREREDFYFHLISFCSAKYSWDNLPRDSLSISPFILSSSAQCFFYSENAAANHDDYDGAFVSHHSFLFFPSLCLSFVSVPNVRRKLRRVGREREGAKRTSNKRKSFFSCFSFGLLSSHSPSTLLFLFLSSDPHERMTVREWLTEYSSQTVSLSSRARSSCSWQTFSCFGCIQHHQPTRKPFPSLDIRWCWKPEKPGWSKNWLKGGWMAIVFRINKWGRRSWWCNILKILQRREWHDMARDHDYHVCHSLWKLFFCPSLTPGSFLFTVSQSWGTRIQTDFDVK